MIQRTDFKIIEGVARDFFEKMSLDIKTEVKNPVDLTIPINLEMEEPQILIGERGQTLIEAQWLLKSILRKRINQQFYIDLDVNGYKKKKAEYLRELAKSTADEVTLSKRQIELASMPAYERRLIHLELAARSDVASESLGEGPERRVVVKPQTL
ncbi:MAG TPA: R3H domain-containing nucleic acid-binding protein [Candidatus Parcubacteria bacterium]|jgi:spoIIIJ-associated protein|nr:hypothetical protein [Parcubacteria group bacterium]HJN62014.1 R3H domain-containing nucleic acid-binding protein [Candidatus Parcubacteria bacterium]